MAINPVFYLKFPYRPLKDLIPVTQIVDVPGCLVVHPSLPAKNVKELIAHMKANPGKLNYGAPAPSSANALEMHMFLAATGTNAVQIAYKGGAGPAMIGLLGNEVQMMFVTFSSAVGFAKPGRVRMLAVISPERNPALPEVPTMREQGLDMAVGSWQGVFVPEGHAEARRGQALSRQRGHDEGPAGREAHGRSRNHDRHQQVPGGFHGFRQGGNRALRKSDQGRQHPDRMMPLPAAPTHAT